MPITLSTELEAEIAARVASGRYPSEEAVIGRALALLREQEEDAAKRAALIADISAGVASLDAGRGVALTRDLIDSMKAAGRQRKAHRESGAHG